MQLVHKCFLDDSKDATQKYSYVCGGFLARASTWRRFCVDWNKALAAEGISYFKTSEYRSLEGQFAQFRLLEKPFGRQAADAVRERLVSVVLKYEGIRGVAVAIPVDVFALLKTHPSSGILTNLEIYDMAFQEVLNIAAQTIDEGYIEFAHDDGPDFVRLRAVYNAFCGVNHRYRSPRMGGFSSLDDKLQAPLQIADMLANSVMRGHVELMNGRLPDQTEEIWDRSDIRVMDKRTAFMTLAHELRRRGSTVPDDLIPYLPTLRDRRDDIG